MGLSMRVKLVRWIIGKFGFIWRRPQRYVEPTRQREFSIGTVAVSS